jgi:hypothetical protein
MGYEHHRNLQRRFEQAETINQEHQRSPLELRDKNLTHELRFHVGIEAVPIQSALNCRWPHGGANAELKRVSSIVGHHRGAHLAASVLRREHTDEPNKGFGRDRLLSASLSPRLRSRDVDLRNWTTLGIVRRTRAAIPGRRLESALIEEAVAVSALTSLAVRMIGFQVTALAASDCPVCHSISVPIPLHRAKVMAHPAGPRDHSHAQQ